MRGPRGIVKVVRFDWLDSAGRVCFAGRSPWAASRSRLGPASRLRLGLELWGVGEFEPDDSGDGHRESECLDPGQGLIEEHRTEYGGDDADVGPDGIADVDVDLLQRDVEEEQREQEEYDRDR